MGQNALNQGFATYLSKAVSQDSWVSGSHPGSKVGNLEGAHHRLQEGAGKPHPLVGEDESDTCRK